MPHQLGPKEQWQACLRTSLGTLCVLTVLGAPSLRAIQAGGELLQCRDNQGWGRGGASLIDWASIKK